MVISGDTTYSEQVIEKAKNCDLLIHEIAHASEHTLEKYPKAKGVISYHSDASQVSKIINTVKPRLTILNHVLSLDGSSDDEILSDIKKNSQFYFVHSYALKEFSKNVKIVNSSYVNIKFPAIVKENNTFGCQFHPEKSRENGLKLINNFLNL